MSLKKKLNLVEPKIISIVGAGGKTTLLKRLASELINNEQQVLVTSTTKMFTEQVAEYNPIIISDYEKGKILVQEALNVKGHTAWLSVQRDYKVDGLPAEYIEKLWSENIRPYILIEADGARNRWLKVPGSKEPVVPPVTHMTLGVINLKVIGQRLDEEYIHRVELLKNILNKQEHDYIEVEDIIKVILHQDGLFCRTYGQKLVILNESQIKYDEFKLIKTKIESVSTEIKCYAL